MTNPHSHRIAATSHQPPMNAADIDALLIDDADDDYLDRHLASIRESLTDFRNS